MEMAVSKIKIPPKLLEKQAQFIELEKNSKIPVRKNWQKNPLSSEQIQPWIEQGNNYGVLGGYGNLIIIDTDTPEASEIVEEHLPDTFTVKTPGGGFHFYYICPNIKKKIVLKKEGVHYGEIISYGSQVVGPGSIHPDTLTPYILYIASDISEVSAEQVLCAFNEYIDLGISKKDIKIETDAIKITDILAQHGIATRTTGNQLVCSHPVHGSTNNNNFVVNPQKNVWHCFRCDSGGGPLSLIAVLENIIDCSQAKPGTLRDKKFTEVIQIAKDRYGYRDDGVSVKSIKNPICGSDEIDQIKNSIQVISPDTDKTHLPELLDPILKKLATLNPAQEDAILRYTIKDHFGLTLNEISRYERILKNYRKELKKENKSDKLSKDNLLDILENEEDSISVHPAQDFSDGRMNYAVIIKDTPCIVTSDKQLIPFDAVEEYGIRFAHKSVNTSQFSYSGMKQFLHQDVSVNITGLYKRIHNYLKRYICFPDDSHIAFLTLWIMGTYIFRLFRYYPYVWLNAEKGSGKTLLMEILSAIAFNGDLVTNPTESVIFRDITNNLITMFIDEVEQLRNRDKDTYGSLISILNAGFNKSGRVKRSEGNGNGGFDVKNYCAYSPKMFAGINDIDDVLQDRTIKIPLLRKKDNEAIQRYKQTPDILKEQQEIRDELYIFGLTYAKEISEIYNQNNSVIKGIDHLGNRDLDILEPIFLLANIVDSFEGSYVVTQHMENLSKKSIAEKQSDNISQNETYKILHILKNMFDEVVPLKFEGDLKIYDSKAVFEFFQNTEEYEWIKKANTLTSRFKKVKIRSEQRRFDGDKKRVYILDTTQFNDLCDRYKI